MKSAIIRMREYQAAATASETELLKYMLGHIDEVAELNIRELAKRAYTSAGTVVRLCQHLEFDGYADFRHSLALELAIEKDDLDVGDHTVKKGDSIEQVIQKVISNDIRSLTDSRKLIDADELKSCVDILMRADSILLYGMGASFNTARDFHLKLLRLNKLSIINENWHAQLLTAQNARPTDAALIFSYSGQTSEMIKCAKALKANQTPIIGITRFVQNPIQDIADHCLFTTSSETIIRTGAMASRISQLAIVDIIYTCMVNAGWDTAMRQIKRTHIYKE